MKYVIKYENSFNEPFYGIDNNVIVKHDTSDTYTLDDVDMCKDALKNLLDIPEAELSLDSIKEDFSSKDFPLSEQKAIQIQTYYNGRFALYNTIAKDLDNASTWQFMEYDIPAEYNSFGFDDNDNVKQHYSKISIQKVA